MSRELVIAHYTENLDWLRLVPDDYAITIVHKGGWDWVPRPSRGGAVTVIPRQNEGREGETFLTYITERYRELADVTVFVQGDPLAHIDEDAFRKALVSMRADKPQPLGRWWLYAQADGQPHHPGLPLPDFARQIGITTGFPLGFIAGAQWAVPKAAIQARSVSFYIHARAQLLQNELYGYCLERLWPVIWQGQASLSKRVWGLMYTHHLVSDTLLRNCLGTIRGMGLADEQLVVVGWRGDERFKNIRLIEREPHDKHWIPAIYEQMLVGLDSLPDEDWVVCLEHDVLYPLNYLDTMREAMQETGVVYYYTLLRHLDIRPGQREDFWSSDPNGTRTLQSCCGGQVATVKAMVEENLARYHAGTLGGDFEIGLQDGRWRPVAGDQPVLDVRQGANATTTGYDRDAYFTTSYHPYWGHARHWRQRLMA